MIETLRTVAIVAAVLLLIAWRFGFMAIWAPRCDAVISIVAGAFLVACAVLPQRSLETRRTFTGTLATPVAYYDGSYSIVLTGQGTSVGFTFKSGVRADALERPGQSDLFRVIYAPVQRYSRTAVLRDIAEIEGKNTGWHYAPPLSNFAWGGAGTRILLFLWGALLMWYARHKWIENSEVAKSNAYWAGFPK